MTKRYSHHPHGHTISHAVLLMTSVALVSVITLSWTLPRRSHVTHAEHDEEPKAEERRRALEHVLSSVGPHPPRTREEKARHTLATLKNGTDYFADYEITVVEEPEDIDPNKKYFFHYPNPQRVKYPYKMLSKWPRIYMFPEFITDHEADTMIEMANRTMKRSLVSQKEDGGVSEIRTSTQTWLDVGTEPVAGVAARLRDLTGVKDHESLQILRYEKGQRYGAHPDYWKVTKNGEARDNRAITCYIYLSDVEEGGETSFPRADGRLIPRPFNSETMCNTGLRVRPKKRSLVIFYDMTPEGAVDAHSLHAACPVKKGVKWGFTLWMHVPLNVTVTDQPVVGFDF